ncbi:caspase family protein [Streptomyces katrae]|uniref:caspase family protein n=1 Tax=Streptomyces katrae TaxID=68223 RepID=UPI0004BF105E|nr:caspase family protein [Streptomyces katrae]
MNSLHFALVIGIRRYPGIGDLAAPVQDAQMFRDWLVHPTGGQVPQGQVTLITTSAAAALATEAYDARPIKREIDNALEEINDTVTAAVQAAAAAGCPEPWKQTRLYIYVAGHGIMPGGGETALLLADARAGRYENLELSNYVKWYRRCGVVRELVVFADCCRQHLRLVEPSIVGFDLCANPTAEVHTLVGYAAGEGNLAYEETEETIPPDERRGYFTRALVAGLRQARKDPAHGAVTAVTLAEYVAPALEEATQGKPFPQRSQMPSDPGRPIVFGTALEACSVTLHFPQGWTGGPVELLLQDGTRASHDPAAGPWSLSLPPGAYGVVLPGTYDGTPFQGRGLFMAVGDTYAVKL